MKMRVWDIDPGYLNRQSLLGEHRELHGIVSILVNKKTGYSHHPETLRWVGFSWALGQRHRALVAEMELRGYKDSTPVALRSNSGAWPAGYIDPPHRQVELIREKYQHKEGGRIPLPTNPQQLWSHHKYSVLARDPKRYREIGKELSTKTTDTTTRMKPANGQLMQNLHHELVGILRQEPTEGGLRNALQHMWGYVSHLNQIKNRNEVDRWPLKKLLVQIQKGAMMINQPYLLHSTALGELMAWL